MTSPRIDELMELRRHAEHIAAALERHIEGFDPSERHLLRLAGAHALALADELDRITRSSGVCRVA